MERLFYMHGKSVAKRPIFYIFLCLAVTALCGAGLLKFRQENNGIKLFIPEKSDQRSVSEKVFSGFIPSSSFLDCPPSPCGMGGRFM
jgi:hypothetical protein